MDISFLGSEFGKIMLFGFGCGFTVGVCILGISTVVHKLLSFYK